MASHHAEHSSILGFLQQFLVVGHLYTFISAEAQLSAHLLIDANVKFSHVNVVNNLGILAHGSLHLLFRGAVDIVVSLHTDTVNRYTGSLHVLHHLIDTVALCRIAFIIVVIEQQRVRVGFTGILECFADKLVVATNLIECALAQRLFPATAVGYALVEHVPGINYILVAVHYGMYMFAHTFKENFLLYQFMLLVIEHPLAHLVVPHQGMSTQFYAVLSTEIGNAVSAFPCPFALLRVYHGGFHVVFSRYTAELLLYQCALFLVRDIALVYSYANKEIILVSFFQAPFAILRICAG